MRPLPEWALDCTVGDLVDRIEAQATELERLRATLARARPIDSREACGGCGWVGDIGVEVAADECPSCGAAGLMTTYYGDPEWRIQEHQLWTDAQLRAALDGDASAEGEAT